MTWYIKKRKFRHRSEHNQIICSAISVALKRSFQFVPDSKGESFRIKKNQYLGVTDLTSIVA